MMRKIIILLAIIFVIGVLYFWYQKYSPSIVTNNQNNAPQVITPTTTTSSSSDLLAGGSSYLDSKNVYSFLYPNDYTIDQMNEGRYTRISKKGATQKGQTEMYDGVIIVFESLDLGSKSLSEWVDSRIKESTSDGTSKVTKPKKGITINNYPGFTYTIRSLGESEYYVVQKDKNSKFAVSITTLVADPENVGYQKEVERIFSTLQLLK